MSVKKLLIVLAVLIVGVGVVDRLNVLSRQGGLGIPTWRELWSNKKDSNISPSKTLPTKTPVILKGTDEERLVNIIDKSLPSVVTVGINFTRLERGTLELDPSDPFGSFWNFRRTPAREREVEQNIGSGFIVTDNGLIITNRHVVDQENAKYKIRLNDGETYDVVNMYKDPLNDLSILKIDVAKKLKALPLGDSDNLKLGQTTIAIGTPLGEFTNSVTTGIVSGLGRGITAGSPFEGFVEKLDNVIQTDAAISPGNSGGPLLNSSGQVIGVNTAVSGEGENIGFAIPVNIVKTLLTEFEERGGSFERPYMGIQYQMIDRRSAIANDLVEGAFIEAIVKDSPADKAGLQEEDIITKIDGEKIVGTDDQSIVRILLKKQIGQTVQITYWRGEEERVVSVKLESYNDK